MKKILFISALSLFSSSVFAQDWRTATRASAGLAPNPQEEKRAVVQVYAARTVNWRGYFAVHSWIATKAADADAYTTYHVIGWNVRRGLSAVRIEQDVPDRHWFGAKPELIESLVGEEAEKAIPQIDHLAKNYFYQDTYRAYPGPNSNTFISHIIREVPELRVELPPHAIGKDWIHDGQLAGWSETKTGVQLSLFGMLGLTLGLKEGIELNLLGLNFGVDFLRPALKLPMVGRLGMKDK
ncbi:MAG: DUF3750 domain-containing protein [Bdellovibrio sp.]